MQQQQWTEQEELEFLLNHPFIGAAPEGDGDGGEGNEAPKEGEEGYVPSVEGEHRDPGAAGDKPPKDGKWIPKHRFDEINQGYTKYKEFGSPEEIKKALGRLAQLEQLPANRTTDKEKSEIRKELLNVFPELSVMSNMLEVQKAAYLERGVDTNNEFLKELNIEVSESTNRYMQELLSGVIAADPKLLRRFYAMDPKVFADAFAAAKKVFWPNARKPLPAAGIQGKKIPPKAPLSVKPGETPPPKKKGELLGRLEERDVLDQASEEAFAMLESSRTE